MKKLFCIFLLVGSIWSSKAQTTNDVLELLIKNRVISQQQADSVRAEAAIKQVDLDANRKSFQPIASRLLNLSGYTQVRYRFNGEKGKVDGFDIRRARLDIKGNFTPYFGYRLQTEFAGSPKVLDAYAEVKLTDYLNITIGQAKIPFSFENLQASSKLESIDRSQVVEALTARSGDVIGNQNGRDIGVQVGGSLLKKGSRYLIDYKVGIFNGGGVNLEDKNDNKDFSGRVVFHPIKGLDLGGSLYSGIGNFGKPTALDHVRNRQGVELNYESGLWMLRGEFIAGQDAAVKKEGWYSEAGYYVLPSRLQLIVKVDQYDPNKDVSSDRSTNYSVGGTLNFNAWSRLQGFYTYRHEEGASVKNNFAVLQYQINF